jgi:APA family basic amino acid/polyamine antiporter
MSRDGLMPDVFSRVHPRFHTPHIITMITGAGVALFAAVFPVGALADISNAGTLFAFFMVALGVMMLRVQQPGRHRSFRTPFIWVIGPLAMGGCALLFASLGAYTIKLFFGWAFFGLVVYFLYARRNSHVGIAEAARQAS